ncbi:hypothetical protein [Actinoallomurus acanthiterrae]
MSETITEYLDLDWFRQQHLTSQNPFDIIPVHGASSTGEDAKKENALTRLYQEYREALLSPEQIFIAMLILFLLTKSPPHRIWIHCVIWSLKPRHCRIWSLAAA